MARQKIVTTTFLYLLAIIALVSFIFPFVLLIINSFKTNGEILTSPFALPENWNFAHFADVINMMNFGVTFRNSFIVTTLSTLFIVFFSAMAAYHLVRRPSKFNKFFFTVLVASMVIPFQSLMIPLIYIYGAKLQLIDAIPIPLLIIFYLGFGSALSVFMFHGFIKSIPIEVEEAARIDGCNSLQIFFLIVLPMLKPIAVTISILNVLWIWNDYLLPSLVLNNESVYTMPVQMKVFNGTYMNNWELLIPAILLTVIPILIMYMIGQRAIINGVMQGSIK
ncbi:MULTISPECIES: carbohydrate ABC transporter permease [Bacillaceae]|uniref:Sugar ABC transporter permease n=2 Tax=Bacillus infantis TaxID=324767 RepID=U5LI28_9BACI|nr:MULTISPECIES: carbohydrate ABC transporter permease [Bacillus]OXT15124.1 sugar ABC transporter permease [Bacillus sp. OG2]AGX06316.1 sugar ABC transporter permease [Bacillus infantis NRRL B-14911]EAR68761.1 multiple sugar-binding transport system permease [Bacillus sp. NRRL B-14911]MCA1033649.1 carbohydrate ABC transporter permease [Bacillus infantis]MCK6207104.1 carbohydrate ABC transporter permease [Bacillus infantis]